MLQARALYPAEVEDVLDARGSGNLHDESVSVAGVAGFAVVASIGGPRAHLFALMGGSASNSVRDAIPLPLPASSSSGNRRRAPRLAMWATVNSNPSHPSMQLSTAALDSSGSLRVYLNLDPNSLDLVHARDSVGRDALFVFGGRGSAAIVRLGEHSPSVEPLESPDPAAESGKRSGISFGNLFHAALRSISGDARPDAADFEAGIGAYRIVGSGCSRSFFGACVAREGGTIELWGPEHLAWTLNLFEMPSLRSFTGTRRIVSTGVSVDDSLICLAEEELDGLIRFVLIGLPITEDPPTSISLRIELNDLADGIRPSKVIMALSEGIAFFHVPETRALKWISVARGVEVTDQVHGSLPLSEGIRVLEMMNASHETSGRGLEALAGGVVACLCSDAVHMVSSGVPAPVSVQNDVVLPAPVRSEEPNTATLLWIAQLQFGAGQTGASRASLRAFYRSAYVNGVPSASILGEVVQDICQRIVSSQADPNVQPMALIIDTELEDRQSKYDSFVRLLGDPDAFNGIRDDAPTTTDDRLWDALLPDVRHAVLSHGEMLAAARAIRGVENNYVSGSSTMYRDHGTPSTIGSEFHGTRTGSDIQSLFGEGLREVEEQLNGGASIVARALQLAGARSGAKNVSTDVATHLYRFPLSFNLFLPALRDCLVDSFTKGRQQGPDFDSVTANMMQRALRAMTILACDAAVAVTQAARETRAGFVRELERDFQVLRSFRDWSWNEESRSVLEILVDSALDRCSGGRQFEIDALHRRMSYLTDELLACTRNALCDAEVSPSVSGTNIASSAKRRRVIEGDSNSPWGRARVKALDRLRSARLPKDALTLAEKYRDFGTIMSLKSRDEDFDAYFVSAIDRFGDDFAVYAFRWLEEKGEIRLLLKGRGNEDCTSWTRTQRVNSLVSTYFREDRSGIHNLDWMHWLTTDDLSMATRSLCQQTRLVNEPGHTNSLESTKVLASITKLSVLGLKMELEESEGLMDPADSGERRRRAEKSDRYIHGVLYRSNVQAKLNEGQRQYTTVLKTEELVEKYLDEAPIESGRLSTFVTVALETVRFSEMEEKKAEEVSDGIWRRCVVREGHLWQRIVSGVGHMSDDQLRNMLKKTAMFQAAVNSHLNAENVGKMMKRNTFQMEEIADNAQLERVLAETVRLAQLAA